MYRIMFTEYDVAGITSKTGLRPNGTGGWRDLMAKNQFTAANQGPAFAKILMRLFAQANRDKCKTEQTDAGRLGKAPPFEYYPQGPVL
jgi:hypothetical protein